MGIIRHGDIGESWAAQVGSDEAKHLENPPGSERFDWWWVFEWRVQC